ncbi:hypothetical protein DVH05_018713 [Phytophthora capsici]|nr:hypothetical protein DVH05_018713 [Phytophthora capsici]
MATYIDGSLPRSMSLSRRYLSLPQELVGTSLPPQVSGKRRGFVTLCVAHILPSAVSSLPLPRESLVRVRWWGEEAPGSLFRPQLLSEDYYSHKTRTDEASYSPHRAISMKYPVTVLPEQLLEYFEDMGNLTLEVIDRDSRKKYGECLLPLNLQKENEVMTAEEKLVALRRENVLSEVKLCGEDEVAGYLAVTFDVNWTEMDVDIEENVEEDVEIEYNVENVERFVAGSSVSSSLPSNREWMEVDSQRTEIEDVEKEIQQSNFVKEKGEIEEEAESRGRRNDFIRIQKLLEKGKALKQSMEKAVKDKGVGGRLNGAIADEILPFSDVETGMQPILHSPLFAPEPDFVVDYNKMSDALVTNGWLPESAKLAPLTGSAIGVQPPSAVTEEVNTTSRLILPEDLNTLMISFESLELNHAFVDSHLRHLRDASSVSSRSSPIQIHVSHDGTLPHLAGEKNMLETPAFAVTTALRKREWRLNCFSTVPLTHSPGILDGNNNETGNTPWNKRDNAKQFRFRVRCENQHDYRRNKRRQKRNLFPRTSKRILLEGVVAVSDLIAVAKRVDKSWTTTINLHVKRTDNEVSEDPNGDELKKTRKGKYRSVGYLKLKFAFHHVDRSNVSEMKSAEDERESEMLLSSISSNPSEVKVDPKDNPTDAISDISGRSLPRDQSNLKDSMDTYKSFQFAVMLDDVSIATPSSLSYQRGWAKQLASGSCSGLDDNVRSESDINLLDAASISVQYSVPSHFSKTRPVSDKFERTITRKLKESRWSRSSSLLWADFNGDTHVFQTSFADDSYEYLSSGYLIVEIWTNFSDSNSSLIGLAKVPLGELAAFLRADETEVSTLLKRPLPVGTVDGRFPIENPFTGHISGYFKGRVCFGTAEQIHTWRNTIRAVIKLQAILRGVFSRQHFRRVTSSTSRLGLMSNQSTSELSSMDNRSELQSTAPTLTPGTRATCFNDNDTAELETSEIVLESSEWRAVLRSIRFQIRKKWRSATRQENGQHSWSNAPLLGCELQGQLVLIGDKELPAKVKGVSFALWWDAADSKLNSSFVHVFRSKKTYPIADDADGMLMGPQSQVLFALHVENGFFGSQSRETIMGEARLNLFQTICKNFTTSKSAQKNGAGELMIDVDIPIEWDTGCSGFQKLASFIPLKISYQISLSAITESNLVDRLDFYNDDVMDPENDFHIDLRDAPDKRLKPASIALSFSLYSVTGFEYLVDGKRRYLIAAGLPERDVSSIHLRDILNSSHDALSAFFEIQVCLGEELDKRETVLTEGAGLNGNTIARVYADNGKWFKRWRSPEVSIRKSGCQIEDLNTLSHQFSMHACMLLNPVTVANLQEECAEVTVLLSCTYCGSPHILGCIEVPLGAVLFRPQGVRGVFPICVGKDPTAARVGVHCFIDHKPHQNESDGLQIAQADSLPSYSDIQLIPGLMTPSISPTSPDEIIRTERNLLKGAFVNTCEVFIEEGRNIVVNDVGITPRLYATFDMAKGGVRAVIHEPDATSGKRTEAKDGTNPRWNTRETVSIDNVDWQSLSLEVSVWMEDRDPPTGPQLSQTGHDMFVGMVRVDLSLFSRGWSDIDGWYHVQDAQYLTRGQIKIHVRNMSVENSTSLKAAASSLEPRRSYQEEPAFGLDRHGIESATDKTDPTQAQISLGDNEHVVQDSFKGEINHDKDGCGKSAEVPFDSSRHEGNSIESSRTLNSDSGVAAGTSSGRNMDTPTNNEPPRDAVRPISNASDNSVDLNIQTDYFQPMTLVSFGTKEMELSPVCDETLSVDKNEYKGITGIATSSHQAGSTPFRLASPKHGMSDCSLSIPSSGEEEQARENIDLEFPIFDIDPHGIGEQHEEHAGGSDIELVANSVTHSSLDRDIDAHMLLQNNDRSETVQHDKVLYAEKTVQVDTFELEQIEMVSCSIQTMPDENLLDEDIFANNGEGNDQLGDIISTVDVGCDAMEDMNSPRDACRFTEKAIQVDPSELGLQIEMVPCSVQTVPEEIIQFEAGEVVSENENDGTSSGGPGEACQFAEKAIQVDSSELGLQIEMVPCSVQSVPEEIIQFEAGEVNSENGSQDDHLEDNAATAMCQGEYPDNPLHCNPNQEPAVATKEEMFDEDEFEGSNINSEEDIATDSCERKNFGQKGIGEPEIYRSGSADIKLQNEMLELVYEMLREMRDAFFERKIEKPASPREPEDLESLKEKLMVETVPQSHSMIVGNEARQERCSCPSSPMSHARSARKGSLDNTAASVSFFSQDPVKLTESSSKNGNRLAVSIGHDLAAPTSRKVENATNRTLSESGHILERTSLHPSFSRRLIEHRTDGQSLVAASHRNTASYRDTIDSFASSQTHAVKSGYSSSKTQLYESGYHSSAHSLFARDSETERIARIMQGSMKYWMKDDSSSNDEKDDSEDDDTSDNCYF